MAAVETCSRCGEEVRRGWRHGREAYWHRVDVDHEPVFGHVPTPEDLAELEAARDRPWQRVKDDGTVETWTAREWDRSKMSKAKRDALDAEEVDPDAEPEHDLEPVEVRGQTIALKGPSTVYDVDGQPRETAPPGGARNLINLAGREDWEVVSLTYARGPYVGAKGGSLGVRDSHRLVVRGPLLDGVPTVGVAWWQNGKADVAHLMTGPTTTRVGLKGLSTWMKETPRGQSA